MAQATHRVKHDKLFMRVNGKLQHVAVGSEITLTKEMAEGFSDKVEAIRGKPAVKVDDTPQSPANKSATQQQSER